MKSGELVRQSLAAALFVSLAFAACGDDVRERVVFSGPFPMRDVRRASFVFDCDRADLAYRHVAYFASGKGYYVVPFKAFKSGRNEIVLDRNACAREEGKVAGWGNVQSVTISFYHDNVRVPKWSVKDFKLVRTPYDAVVVTADACAHAFPSLLEACGLDPILIGADELDDAVLSTAELVVPITGKTPFPKKAEEAIRAFKARGGGVLSYADRVNAGRDIVKLTRLVGVRQPRLVGKMTAWREKVRQQVEANRRAAQAFPAFMDEGGADELRVLFCHTAYGPERVQDETKWEDWDRSCAWLKKMGFNAVCVNVCRGGIAFYRSEVLPMAAEVEAKGDSVDLIRRACEKHGLKFIAWKVCFRSRVGMKTPAFEKWIADGRGAVSFDGKRDDEWLCPVRPENRALEVSALVELAKRRPWAISLDYIRYSSSEWCFCDACRAAFEKHVGHPVADWPKAVRADADLSRRWNEFRRESITGIVRDVVRRVRAEAPGVKIHASVFRFPRGDALSVAQDWGRWCREGWLDVAAPMDGADSPAALEPFLTVQKAERAGALLVPTLYPSIWKDEMLGAKDLMDQIRTCRAAGLPGFGVFTFDGKLINMISTEADIPSVTPTDKCDKAWWAKRHAAVKAKAAKGGYPVVFLGDSITHFWEKAGKEIWAKHFAEGAFRALNCGFAGDTTENLLWRIDDGELDGLDPKTVVVMIGTNNTGHRPVDAEPPANTVRGVRAVLDRVRAKFPNAKVVLHALLPRGARYPNPTRTRNDEVNRRLEKLADGTSVVWCDFGPQLMHADGTIGKEMFGDFLHPTAAGYEIWANALLPLLGAKLPLSKPQAAVAAKPLSAAAYVLAVPKNGMPIDITKEMWVGRCVLKGNRVPFKEVDGHSFTDDALKDTKIVFMGKSLKLAPESAAAVKRFQQRGGAVVRFNRYQFKDADVLYSLAKKAAPDDAAFWTELKAKNARIRAEELKEIAKMPGKAGEIRRMSFHDAQWKQKIDGEPWSWDRAIGTIKAYGFNVASCFPVYPNYAYYRSKVFPVGSAIDSEGDVVEAFVAACRKHGVKSSVSVRCFKTKVDQQLPEPYLAEWLRRAAEPGRMCVSRSGKVHAGALCPAYPDTRRRLVEGVLEVAAYGVDQISLDFIRFIDHNHCFCERCKAGIAAAGGDEGRYRRETVTSVVREIRAALKAKFPKVELAASVFQNPDAYSARIGQPWDKWCEEGLFDEISPMDYLLEPADFEKLVRQQAPRQTHGVRTVPIFGPNLWPDDGHMELRAAEMIRRVRTVDATAGFAMFLFERRMLDILDALKDGPLRQD